MQTYRVAGHIGVTRHTCTKNKAKEARKRKISSRCRACSCVMKGVERRLVFTTFYFRKACTSREPASFLQCRLCSLAFYVPGLRLLVYCRTLEMSILLSYVEFPRMPS